MRIFLSFVLIWMIEVTGAYAQSVIHENGKCGLADENGKVILKTEYDTILPHNKLPTLFIVKNEGRFAYAYKVESDGAKWLPEAERHWTISEFEFDTLHTRAYAIDVAGDDSQIMYAHLQYKKNGLWGMIIIESHMQSGTGIFVSAGSYADGLGKSFKRGMLYDTILGFEFDGFYNTRLNGKYGLFNPGTNEEYAPEFDTVPVFEGMITYGTSYGVRERYVRKNGKWGVIMMNPKTRTIQYSVPCRCNQIMGVGQNTYACMGSGDTITFFDTLTHTEYAPLVNGKPLIFSKDSMIIAIYEYDFGELNIKGPKPFILQVENKNNPPPEKIAGYNEVYWIDPVLRQVTAFNEPGTYYHLFLGSTRLIGQTNLHSSSSETRYNFYDLETKQFLFNLDLNSKYVLRYNFYGSGKCALLDDYSIAELYYYDRKDRKKVIGYYNSNQREFTRRKPKCK